MVRTLDDCTNDYDDEVINNIAERGWHVANVTNEKGPGWSFSIGLYQTFGHPEIIVFGLGTELGHQVIDGLGHRIKAGNRIAAEHEYGDILANVRCIFKPVRRKWYEWLLGYARWYYEGDDFPVLQCLWPDKEQNYPWESAFKAEWAWVQPFLFHEDEVLARAAELVDSLKELNGS
jgi:hypothetical protein